MTKREIKRYKFEFGGMFMYYFGSTIGEAIKALIDTKPIHYVQEITAITEEPIRPDELP